MASKPPPLSGTEIDALYGLEPVLFDGDRDAGSAPPAQDWLELTCPACGEQIGTAIDLSAGSISYVEDCQVCCRPMVIHLECDEAGNLLRGWADNE